MASRPRTACSGRNGLSGQCWRALLVARTQHQASSAPHRHRSCYSYCCRPAGSLASAPSLHVLLRAEMSETLLARPRRGSRPPGTARDPPGPAPSGWLSLERVGAHDAWAKGRAASVGEPTRRLAALGIGSQTDSDRRARLFWPGCTTHDASQAETDGGRLLKMRGVTDVTALGIRELQGDSLRQLNVSLLSSWLCMCKFGAQQAR